MCLAVSMQILTNSFVIQKGGTLLLNISLNLFWNDFLFGRETLPKSAKSDRFVCPYNIWAMLHVKLNKLALEIRLQVVFAIKRAIK